MNNTEVASDPLPVYLECENTDNGCSYFDVRGHNEKLPSECPRCKGRVRDALEENTAPSPSD